MRYRLRFHLQEIDLIGDEVVVGRGSMGHVTIDDPMLSRRHIRIDLSGAAPTLEDLESAAPPRLKLVAVTRLSNATGVLLPVDEIAAWAHSRGARVVALDGHRRARDGGEQQVLYGRVDHRPGTV